VPPYISVTDQNDSTGRCSWWQELALPVQAGAFKIVPYGKLVLAEYTQDLDGQATGRVWGGGGVRGSLPLTRLYPDVQSELFNVNGINHKIVISGNYFYAEANEPHTRFPQLDRLNDDVSDQNLRDIRPYQPLLNTGNGYFLTTSPVFDPQVYALRRLIDNRLDTLDSIEVLQMDVRQRWQTKRGYPGMEHIVDYMILDTSASYFPNPSRDNFGKPWAFLEYQWLWNIGDRTALESTGWIDPYHNVPGDPGIHGNGPYVFTVGAYFNRPDRTNFYLGYRQLEPLLSRAVTGAMTYIFSPKYATTLSATYDMGAASYVSTALVFTRIGTDVQVSVGVSYNSLLVGAGGARGSFGALFEIVPNLVPANKRTGAMSSGLLGPGGMTGP
jgi:hypothetical protein